MVARSGDSIAHRPKAPFPPLHSVGATCLEEKDRKTSGAAFPIPTHVPGPPRRDRTRPSTFAVEPAKADVERAKAKLPIASLDLQRATLLVRSQAVTEREFESRRSTSASSGPGCFTRGRLAAIRLATEALPTEALPFRSCYGREDPPARVQSSPSSQGSGLSSQDAGSLLA